jgi:hypothetical protein
MGAAEPAPPPLTPDGWGALKIGMTEAEVLSLYRVATLDTGIYDEPDACYEAGIPGSDFASVMLEDRRVARITLWDLSPVRTDRGIGVGAREAEVKANYGWRLRVEPHHYIGEPAHYLTYWRSASRGVRFETDTAGIVDSIHSGTEAIRYVEGCL